MAKYVIFVTLSPETTDTVTLFDWDVRQLLDGTQGQPLPERAGPSVASGQAGSLQAAQSEAENRAELLAVQTIYLYDTVTSSPTPPPA